MPFAASATVAIENARLFAEARQARQLRALNEVAAALGSTLELQAVLETGLTKALEAVQAEAGAVSLLDETTGELVMAATHGWRRSSVPVGTHIPAGQGLSGLVAARASTPAISTTMTMAVILIMGTSLAMLNSRDGAQPRRRRPGAA